jgi:hypothetical protein
MKLTDEVIRSARPCVKPVKLTDGRGLFLLLAPTGGKWWRYKYRFGGKEKQVSLGVYPAVSIVEARAKHAEYRAMVAEGVDPCAHVQVEKAERKAEAARQLWRTRFMLTNDGALSFLFGKRQVVLSPSETSELRVFLDATKDVTPKVTPCP